MVTAPGRGDGGLCVVEVVLTEWLSIIIRWVHVIAGIAWIGSSFYFIHLDLSLKSRSNLAAGVKGDAWQVHGGGFYHMIKYLVAPAQMPDELTWFKWEAYATWLSGFALLVLVYYLGRRPLPDRQDRAQCHGANRRRDRVRDPARRLAVLRGALPLAARQARGGDRAHRLRLPRRPDLRLHPCVQRPWRLHADRRADRHHHGGERLHHHHPLSEEDRGRAALPARNPIPHGARKASAARSTTTT